MDGGVGTYRPVALYAGNGNEGPYALLRSQTGLVRQLDLEPAEARLLLAAMERINGDAISLPRAISFVIDLFDEHSLTPLEVVLADVPAQASGFLRYRSPNGDHEIELPNGLAVALSLLFNVPIVSPPSDRPIPSYSAGLSNVVDRH